MPAFDEDGFSHSEVDDNGFENLAYLTDAELEELSRLYVNKADRGLLMQVVALCREYFFWDEEKELYKGAEKTDD